MREFPNRGYANAMLGSPICSLCVSRRPSVRCLASACLLAHNETMIPRLHQAPADRQGEALGTVRPALRMLRQYMQVAALVSLDGVVMDRRRIACAAATANADWPRQCSGRPRSSGVRRYRRYLGRRLYDCGTTRREVIIVPVGRKVIQPASGAAF